MICCKNVINVTPLLLKTYFKLMLLGYSLTLPFMSQIFLLFIS